MRASVVTRPRGVAALLAALALLGGCASASFQGAPKRLYGDEVRQLDPLYTMAIDASAGSASPADRLDARNRFIEMRAAVIDHQYDLFRSDLYEQRVGANVGVDVATLGLSGVGAATGSTQVKTAAAAVAAFLIGSKASIDKNVYFDRTLPALLEQMDGARATVRRRLLDSMLLDIGNYPLMQASADLEAYFHAGTIPGAIAGITTQAATQKKAAVEQLEQRLSGKEIGARLKARGFEVNTAVQTPSGVRLQRCIEPIGVTPRPREDALLVWLAGKGFELSPAFGPSDFFTLAGNESLRQQALSNAQLMAQLKGCP